MPVLKLTRWILLYLLARIEFATSQNITVFVHFEGTNPASVLAADPNAATYLATTTNICRSGPCSPLTIYTNLYVQGPSTLALTNYGDGNSETYACVVTSSIMTGTCTYEGTYRGTIQTPLTTSMVSDDFLWWPLTVTAGLDKLSHTTATTNGATSASGTTTSATPASTPPASDTVSNGGATSTVSQGSTAAKGKTTSRIDTDNSNHY